jgi:hypothetical protein
MKTGIATKAMTSTAAEACQRDKSGDREKKQAFWWAGSRPPIRPRRKADDIARETGQVGVKRPVAATWTASVFM